MQKTVIFKGQIVPLITGGRESGTSGQIFAVQFSRLSSQVNAQLSAVTSTTNFSFLKNVKY